MRRSVEMVKMNSENFDTIIEVLKTKSIVVQFKDNPYDEIYIRKCECCGSYETFNPYCGYDSLDQRFVSSENFEEFSLGLLEDDEAFWLPISNKEANKIFNQAAKEYRQLKKEW